MASSKNDALLTRTVEGSHNYYDHQRCMGTATDKGLAARLGGHNYNILSNLDHDEIYFTRGNQFLRHDDHFLDKKGRHTIHMFGDRRRKFGVDERNHVRQCIQAPVDHPRDDQVRQRRMELQLTQIENSNSWPAFQERRAQIFPDSPPKRYSINNAKYCNEVSKLGGKVADKGAWQQRRGESMIRSSSAPSVELADPQGSLHRAIEADTRKEATQRQTESAHFAPWMSANTYSHSHDATTLGKQLTAEQRHCSVNRIENHDFAVARKNNHFSSQDKLTRCDPYYMRPRLAQTNNGVKYDIISNERRWFRY